MDQKEPIPSQKLFHRRQALLNNQGILKI